MKLFLSLCFSLLLCLPMAAFAYNDVVGEVTTYTTRKKNEDISVIARKFDVGWIELVAANPSIQSGKIPKGTKLTIPGAHILPKGERDGILVNLSEMRLFYYADDGSISTHPISIGKEGWATPVGDTEVVDKREDPAWHPPASIRKEDPSLPEIVPPGPDNPLGKFALVLDHHGVLIHGTSSPNSIGKRRSHGCIRLYPEDIEILFGQVSIGTPVSIIDDAFKLGFKGEHLYLEVTPTQEQAMALQAGKPRQATDEIAIHQAITELSSIQAIWVDWDMVEKVIQSTDGIPTAIGYKLR